MPRLLPNEGLTLEALIAPIKHTLLNPVVTAPLLLALIYDPKRVQPFLPVALQSSAALSALKFLVGFGLLRKTNSTFNRSVQNNGTKDTWRYGEEIVLVTGGSSGLGAGFADRMAKHSKAVIIVDLAAPTAKLAPNVHFYRLDVTKSDRIAEVAAAIRKEHGEPTVLINNAGIGSGQTILDEPEARIRLTFEVNTIAHFAMVKEFAPAMIAANHGHIITMASMASFFVNAQNVDYACTKASALAFHEGLASELKNRYKAPKVRTTVVHPGWVKTPLTQPLSDSGKWKEFMLEPETVVDAVESQLLAAKGGQIILPDRYRIMAMVRAWPQWIQTGMRNAIAPHLAVVESIVKDHQW